MSGALGNKDMMSAAQKHAPDLSIIDTEKLNNIINDPEFKSKIRANNTSFEKTVIGIPLFEIPSLPSNPEGSNILEGFSETSGDNDSTDENNTPVIKKSSIRKHNSGPLPRKINKSGIQRRNTR